MGPLFHFFKRKHKQEFKPVVLVTGCSSGIGLAVAHLLRRHPEYRLVLTAREKSLDRLRDEFLEDERLLIRPLDVTSETDRSLLVNEVSKIWGGIDILINNAGISYRAVVEHMTEKDEELQMATNYFGPMGLIRLCLPHMRETGRGKIINVSSVSGMLAMPTMSSYSASKFALEGASEALWYEMRPFGVTISLVQPGFIHSPSHKNVYHTQNSDPARNWNGPYCDFYKNMTPFVENMMNMSLTTPEKVAKQILHTMKTENPPLWIPATLDATVFYYIRRLLPRRVLLPFLYWCLPGARHWAKEHTHRRS
ncbi:SDR family oxidoreductase [Bdellovibrio bacteriovorus]|uniref:Putative oxidoreductase n=1 Tax=Bdellovibrio bacteriovorus str. Tiberius TaxID=1069642 RepID=K7YQB2_BDEBC|nr:SDR family oxidoreductase [Bdellovibrio bacteriovorus]AFX99747.1 putative oxidoreductase [Bdellovibrio bacteriovorus str. Tiberius]